MKRQTCFLGKMKKKTTNSACLKLDKLELPGDLKWHLLHMWVAKEKCSSHG